MGALLEAARAQNRDIAEAMARAIAAVPPHYQDHLGGLIRRVRPSVIVETGVSFGISTDHILTALDEIGQGVLVSIDPSPQADLFAIEHPRWERVRLTSDLALAEVARDHPGGWDVFLHDSDHGVHCQTFEYEAAWHFVCPGGLILSDDYTWGTPAHRAWHRFCERHGVAFTTLGNCAMITKPSSVPLDADDPSRVVRDALELAGQETRNYEAAR